MKNEVLTQTVSLLNAHMAGTIIVLSSIPNTDDTVNLKVDIKRPDKSRDEDFKELTNRLTTWLLAYDEDTTTISSYELYASDKYYTIDIDYIP
jgi:hypothetical protein